MVFGAVHHVCVCVCDHELKVSMDDRMVMISRYKKAGWENTRRQKCHPQKTNKRLQKLNLTSSVSLASLHLSPDFRLPGRQVVWEGKSASQHCGMRCGFWSHPRRTAAELVRPGGGGSPKGNLVPWYSCNLDSAVLCLYPQALLLPASSQIRKGFIFSRHFIILVSCFWN